MCEVPPPLVVQHLAHKELKKSIKHFIIKPLHVSILVEDYLFHFIRNDKTYRERIFKFSCFEKIAYNLLFKHLKANTNETATSIPIPVEFNSFKYIVLFEKVGDKFIIKTHEFVDT